jgi:septum site-determining protein MinC
MTSVAPTTFEIKSANFPLVALYLRSNDLKALSRELTQRFGDIPDFFDQDALVIDLTPLQSISGSTAAEVDFRVLIGLLKSFRLVPLAVKGGSPSQMAAAHAAGLVPGNDAHQLTHKPAEPAESLQQSAPPRDPLYIDKPLRSGQQIYARGRDLVVLAMVNAGAEVIADGSIHVYAPLRGKAIAGARGDTAARIFALSFEPELVSIAGIYRTSEAPLAADLFSKPSQVRLVSDKDGDKLEITALT